MNERKSTEDVKRIAFLVDLQTIHLLDLTTGHIIGQINHDCKIDWLELSGKANKLLFRDKRHQLYLYDVATQSKVTLLAFCSYVQVRL
jgi:intraflagellar transport protein 172